MEDAAAEQCDSKIYEDCGRGIYKSEDFVVCGTCGRGSELSAKDTFELASCDLH